MAKIKVNQFTKAINDILKDYSDEVIQATKEIVDEVSKEALNIVKSKAPVKTGKLKTGKYKKSLKIKNSYESLTEKRKTIYSDGQSGLTHLLEKGHAKVNGGKTKAFPHWKYGDEYIKEKKKKRIEKKLGGK